MKPEIFNHSDYRAAQITDPGRVRPHNEDACGAWCLDQRGFFIVCDGVGGHGGGDRASQLTCDLLTGEAIEQLSQPGSLFPDGDCSELQDWLTRTFRSAHEAVLSEANPSGRMQHMATTAVALVIAEKRYLIGHIGDSRIYRLRNRRLERLTDDHTPVFELYREGAITYQEIRTSVGRNAISRALGIPGTEFVEFSCGGLQPGDRFLLCSDGLHGMLDDPEIEEIFRSASTPDLACRNLVDSANDAGGKDNVTVCVVEIL